jgi:hypothetical protein
VLRQVQARLAKINCCSSLGRSTRVKKSRKMRIE